MLVALSTRSQFGIVDEKSLPAKEDCCQNPISIYGINKMTAEYYCRLYRSAFGIKSVIIRLPQVYGPSIIEESSHNFIEKFIKCSLSGKEFDVYGYGKDLKDVIYVEDVVSLILKAIESKSEGGIYNAGSGSKISLLEIANKVVKICKKGKFRLCGFPKETEKFEMRSFYFDISKASKEFGWKPKIGIDEGIKRTVKSLR